MNTHDPDEIDKLAAELSATKALADRCETAERDLKLWREAAVAAQNWNRVNDSASRVFDQYQAAVYRKYLTAMDNLENAGLE